MAYTRVNWEDLPSTDTPINAANLNKMDKGIYEAHESIGDLTQLNTTDKSNLVGAINSIVESGSNENGNWIRYKNGIMICIKKIKFTNVVINKAWGSVYETANVVNFGNYAQEFIEIPSVSIDLADGSTCFCETFSGRTKKSIGSTWLWKPAVEANGTMTFDIMAIGKWK